MSDLGREQHTDLLADLHVSIDRMSRAVEQLVNVVAQDDDSAGIRTYRNEALLAAVDAVRLEPGRITYIHAYNTNAQDVFLHLYNHLQDEVMPGVGSRKPKLTVVVPGGGGAYDDTFAKPITFTRAISIAVTLNKDGSGGAPGAGLLVDVVSAELE